MLGRSFGGGLLTTVDSFFVTHGVFTNVKDPAAGNRVHNHSLESRGIELGYLRRGVKLHSRNTGQGWK